MSRMIVDQLIVTTCHKDEWPAMVGGFIIDLAEWYAAHPALAEHSAEEIAAFLFEVWENEGSVHLSCSFGPINRSATGRAEHTLNTTIVIDDLRRTLASAALERYALGNAA